MPLFRPRRFQLHAAAAALAAAAWVAPTLAAPDTSPQEKKLPAEASASPYVLLVEPAFMRPKIQLAIDDAKSTVLTVGRLTESGADPIRPAEFRQLGIELDDLFAAARAAADSHLKSIEPKVIRDDRGIARYAVLASKSPRTAGVIFAPSLADTFRDTLGDRLLAAAPDRFTVYLFPRSMPTFRDFGKTLAAAYQDAVYPSSLEVFEIDQDGVRAVGTFLEE